jgi:hypothetical protein
VCGLVRGQVQRRRLAERNAVSRREGERTHPAVRVGRFAAYARTYVGDVVPSECLLNLFGMRQGKACVAQAAAGLPMNRARVAAGLHGAILFLGFAGRALGLDGRRRICLMGLHTGGFGVFFFAAIPELHRDGVLG